MLSLYVGALVFGGILIGASVVLGGDGGDMDVDGDIAMDADLDADGLADLVDVDGADNALADVGPDAALWMPFLSMRFWTFGLAAFGLTGTLLSAVLSSGLVTAGFAAVSGISAGWGAAWSFRVLATKTVTGETTTARYIGQEARVVLPIKADRPGKIALQTFQGRLDMVARTHDGKDLSVGDTVLIAGVHDGIADVTRLLPGGRAIEDRESAT